MKIRQMKGGVGRRVNISPLLGREPQLAALIIGIEITGNPQPALSWWATEGKRLAQIQMNTHPREGFSKARPVAPRQETAVA